MEEVTRKLSGPVLDIPQGELAQEPTQPPAWYERNVITRVLAHLLGFDGSVSRPIRCRSDGRLRVVPENVAGTVLDPAAEGVVIRDPSTAGNRATVTSAGKLQVGISGGENQGGASVLVNTSGAMAVYLHASESSNVGFDTATAGAFSAAVQAGVEAAIAAKFSFDGSGNLKVVV
jgi:hypothetical protein